MDIWKVVSVVQVMAPLRFLVSAVFRKVRGSKGHVQARNPVIRKLKSLVRSKSKQNTFPSKPGLGPLPIPFYLRPEHVPVDPLQSLPLPQDPGCDAGLHGPDGDADLPVRSCGVGPKVPDGDADLPDGCADPSGACDDGENDHGVQGPCVSEPAITISSSPEPTRRVDDACTPEPKSCANGETPFLGDTQLRTMLMNFGLEQDPSPAKADMPANDDPLPADDDPYMPVSATVLKRPASALTWTKPPTGYDADTLRMLGFPEQPKPKQPKAKAKGSPKKNTVKKAEPKPKQPKAKGSPKKNAKKVWDDVAEAEWLSI